MAPEVAWGGWPVSSLPSVPAGCFHGAASVRRLVINVSSGVFLPTGYVFIWAQPRCSGRRGNPVY